MTRTHSSWWWLSAPGLVIALSGWCQLHARALGVEPISLDISMPWALRSAFGWLLAGGLLAHFGARILDSTFASRHPWRTRALIALSIPLLTLSSEVLLLSGNTALGLWLYNRAPLHLPFAALLFAGYLFIRARHLRVEAATTESRPPTGPGQGSESPSPLVTMDVGAAERSVHYQPTLTVEVMTGTGRTHVSLDEIECLEADRNYINVHTPKRTYLLRQTLTSLEKSLRPDSFLRIHRSTIVNRAMIRERRRGGVLVLHSGRKVRVSRAFADRVN